MKTECIIIGKGASDSRHTEYATGMGYAGVFGIVGTTGIRGFTGIVGTTGIQGYTGYSGTTGFAGITGGSYTGGNFSGSYTGGNFTWSGSWRETPNTSFTSVVIGGTSVSGPANDIPVFFASCVVGGISPVKRALNFIEKYWEGFWAILEKEKLLA